MQHRRPSQWVTQMRTVRRLRIVVTLGLEVEEIKEVIKEEERKSQQSVSEVIQDRSFLQPLALTCTLSVVQLISGSDMMEGYLLVIFKDSGVTPKHLAILYQV